MRQKRKGQSRQHTGKKKPYRSPVLTVHGDIGVLTQRKKGFFSDGFGKPRTRASGGNA